MAEITLRLLPIKDAAREAGVSYTTMKRIVEAGRVKTYDLGKHALMVDGDDLQRIKSERKSKARTRAA